MATWVDYVIFCIFFFSTLLGLARGLLREIISILTILVAFVIAIQFTPTLTNLLSNLQGSQDVIFVISKYFDTDATYSLSSLTLAISFLVLFVGTYSIGEAINYYATANVFMFVTLAFIYRISGAALGFIRGYAFSIVFIFVMQLTPITQYPEWTQSYFVSQLQPAANQLGSLVQAGEK